MKQSIKTRLFRSFVLLVAMPVLLFFAAVNTIYWHNTNQAARDQGEAVVLEIESNLLTQFNDFESLITYLERDQNLMDIAALPNPYRLSAWKYDQLAKLLQDYADSVPGIDRIGILYTNGTFTSTDEQLVRPDLANQSPWFATCLQDPDRAYTYSYKTGVNPMLAGTTHYNSSLSICKALVDSAGQSVAVANITLRGEMLGVLMGNVYSQLGGQSYLATADGDLVNSPLQIEDLIGINDRRYLETRRPIQGLPLIIINILPIRPYNNQQYTFLWIGILTSLLFMMAFLIYAHYTSDQFVKPIETLRREMQKAQAGDLDVACHAETDDEFGDLAESFNQMVAEIRHLIAQVYVEQSNKRKAEIAALQAHIKPHFLYNTLDTIHWMARRYQADDIVDAVDALSDLFRVGFSNNHELATVSQEITHAQSYLKIQRLRYHDILDFEIDLDPDVSTLLIQKTILQPIVENALYHGVKEKQSPGRIIIAAKRTKCDLILTVRDTGRGMTGAELSRLQNRLHGLGREGVMLDSLPQDHHGTGLANVQLRLRLSYGLQYGLTIESQLGEGTVVKIRHPILDPLQKLDPLQNLESFQQSNPQPGHTPSSQQEA